MYMLVKCSSKSVRDHPVVGRLAQYRQLLKVCIMPEIFFDANYWVNFLVLYIM